MKKYVKDQIPKTGKAFLTLINYTKSAIQVGMFYTFVNSLVVASAVCRVQYPVRKTICPSEWKAFDLQKKKTVDANLKHWLWGEITNAQIHNIYDA